jgi:protein arginine N-methyltransferase 1
MHSIHGHGLITADRRSDLYADALRRSIRPGDVVVDVGAGTGLWSLYACALGARHVIAIEPDPIVAFAMDAAAANGFADRITFLPQAVRDVTLDVAADVVVADLRDVLPFAPASLTGMREARRFLKPDGVLIPRRDRLWVSVVDAGAAHRARTAPWETTRFGGVDLTAMRRAALSVLRKERFSSADLLAAPVCWAEIDYRTIMSADVCGDATLRCHRAGPAHGLALWFDAELTEDVGFSNAPDAPPLLYGQLLCPWPAAVLLEQGDCIDARVRAIHDGTDYTISWETTVRSGTTAAVRAKFEQSTFDAVPLLTRALELVGRRSAPEGDR